MIGPLRKMRTRLEGEQAHYELPIGDELVPLNERIGTHFSLRFEGKITCGHCGRDTKKSFNQGYCYPCFQRLAQCDSCIVSPEKCHYHEGTCREPEWGEQNCMIDHIVYLANSSGVKVGITRHSQVPTRWVDQGATQALPIFRVASRFQSGLVESAFKDHVADKTSWQAMLKGDPPAADLHQRRDELCGLVSDSVQEFQNRFGLDAIRAIDDAEETVIRFPVSEYPTKVKSHNFDKTPEVGGKLMGIKGQYLMFDTGVINIRKFGSYHVSFLGDL